MRRSGPPARRKGLASRGTPLARRTALVSRSGLARGKPPGRSPVPPASSGPLPGRAESPKGNGRPGLSRAENALRRVPRSRPEEGPLAPEAWARAAAAAANLRCAVSGAVALTWDDPRFEVHHLLEKRLLRARGLHDRVWDARNSLFVSKAIHSAHTAVGVAGRRIPRESLPDAVWEFCAEVDAIEGTFWATDRVRRDHPPATRRE